MPRTAPLTTLACLTLALLSACGTPTAPVAASQTARYDYVASIPLQAGDTPSTVAQLAGGTVLAWNDAGCGSGGSADCVALVGIQAPSSSLGSLQAQSLTAQGLTRQLQAKSGRSLDVERNRDAFSGGEGQVSMNGSLGIWAGGSLGIWAGGSLGIWAGGSLGIWAGGSLGIWAGGTYTPMPENTALWQKVGLPQAQQQAPHLGEGVTVAVVDSGVDVNHPAFQGSLTPSATWRDFYADDVLPQEEGVLGEGSYGHGTNVAGIVLQVAPKAKILPIRVLGPGGSGDAVMVAQGIDWAVSQGAQVINLSLGSTDDLRVVQDAVNRATSRGVYVVSSAGNENLNRITYPAANAAQKGSGGDYALSVGSVNLQDLKSSFSNYAPALELVAPGEQVYAPAPDNRMVAWSGTSMAAPMVTGGLALALGETLDVNRKDLTDKMADNAFDVYKNGANQAYKDQLGQKGRLDLSAFLDDVVKD